MRTADPQEGTKKEEKKVNLEEAKWGEDDDSLGSLDEELEAQGATATGGEGQGEGTEEAVESDIFVPPAPGADPFQGILRQNPTNVALNVAIGDF